MSAYLMAFDQGTTSSRTILFNKACEEISSAAERFTQYFPQNGWVEHDAEEIFETQLKTAREALAKASATAADIAAIGITNQRETVVVWEKKSGKPIAPAIVWQCRRTAEYCDELRRMGFEKTVREKTGLPIDPYFSATKLARILDDVPGARERAERGELLFGTIDSFLIYRLTGGKVHATDPSNASRTLLFNIHEMRWDDDLLRLFRIPACMLPRVLPSAGLFGMSDAAFFGKEIPITGVAGDQQAALFGQCCFQKGEAKNTYGTGGFLLMQTGDTPVHSSHGLLTTVGWQIGNRVSYVLEGSVFICGAAIQWLRDGLGILSSSSESESLATSVSDTGGVYFVPALTGLGSPYWDPYARGTIVGLTRSTTRAHIVRATLEAMAFQTTDLLESMRCDVSFPLSALRVDGGASVNDLLLSFQSDFSGLTIERPKCTESTALGAALLAGLGCGIFSGLAEIAAINAPEKRFSPSIDAIERERRLAAWHAAVECARHRIEQ